MRIIVSLLLTLAVGALGAQPETTQNTTLSFSVEEAKSYALENGYSVRDKQLEVEKARASIKKALALSLPKINANYNTIWNAQIQPQAIGKGTGFIPDEQFAPGEDFKYFAFGADYQTQWDVSASINLSYSNFLARRASQVLRETKDLDLENARINLVNEVEKSYYGVMIARENVSLLDENLQSLSKNYSETQKLYENGFVDEQSVDQLELLVANISNNVANARRQEEIAMLLLKYHMGIAAEQEIVLTGDLDDFVVTQDEGEVIASGQFVPNQHVNYRQIAAQNEAAGLSVRNERSQWYPYFTAGVTHTEAYFSNDFDPINWDTYWAPGTRVTGGLSWNLDVLGRTASVQEAKVDFLRTEVAKEQVLNQVTLQYQRALSNYQFALENHNIQRRNLEISKKIRDKERIKFSEGISGSLDFTQTENQYLETQREYIQSLQNLLYAREDLEKAIGKK